MPTPQPYFVPVSLRRSRTTQSSGVSGPASALTSLPLTVKLKGMTTSRRRAGKRSNDGRQTRCELLRLSQVTECLYLARKLLGCCISRTCYCFDRSCALPPSNLLDLSRLPPWASF